MRNRASKTMRKIIAEFSSENSKMRRGMTDGKTDVYSRISTKLSNQSNRIDPFLARRAIRSFELPAQLKTKRCVLPVAIICEVVHSMKGAN